MYGLFESSSIAPASSTIMSLPFVSSIPDSDGEISFETFPMFESATSVPFTYTSFAPLSVAEKVTPV